MIAASTAAGCGLCANQVFSESISPDGKLKIVIFERNCGATTGFSTQAALLQANKRLPNEAGNVFTSNGYHPRIAAEWTANNQVIIRHPARVQIHLLNAQFGEVKVNMVAE